jgi:hypothetical protein
VWYSHSTDNAPTPNSPRSQVVGFFAQVDPDVQTAESDVQKGLTLDNSSQPTQLGDGSALRSVHAGPGGYQFRVGSVSAGVGVTNGDADDAKLDKYTLALAQLMISKLRAALAQAPVAPDPQALLTGPPPALPDLRPLVLPISAFPAAWSVLTADDTGWRYHVEYVNAADAAVATRVLVTLGLASNPEQAASQVDATRKDLVGTTVNGANAYTATPWEDHDGAYRIEAIEGFENSVTYVFHVGPYYAEVNVELDKPTERPLAGSEALRLARLQETQLEAAVGSP